MCLNPNGTRADEAAHEALSTGYSAEKGAGSHTNLEANGRGHTSSLSKVSSSYIDTFETFCQPYESAPRIIP